MNKNLENLFLNGRCHVMGILNVTPDSFSDGGKFLSVEQALAHAHTMVEQGATIIDIGGESSRPGSEPISAKEELDRVLPVVKALKERYEILVSIDTYKSEVAKGCLDVGADIINDITGLADPNMSHLVSSYRAAVVIMHMQGEPKTMQANPCYGDVVQEVKEFLLNRVEMAKAAGISKIILDPGLGFGKTTVHNLEILRRLDEFVDLGYPVLVGHSRKRFIGEITGADCNDRLAGTVAVSTIAAMRGVRIIRVHDVKESARAVKLVQAMKENNWK